MDQIDEVIVEKNAFFGYSGPKVELPTAAFAWLLKALKPKRKTNIVG